MRESLQPDIIEKRRDEYIDRFCRDLMDTLLHPQSPQDVTTWIDNIFLKLRRFIRNQAKIQNNDEFQKKVFKDICMFLNSLHSNFAIRRFHNSISKTTIDKYKEMTLWEQFFNNVYHNFWNFNYECRGWSCSNRTLTLYKFFDALREAGLDIKLSIYRLKETDDNYAGIKSMRHAWLVINFRGLDYMIDYEWYNDVFSKRLIQSVNTLKEDIEKTWIKDVDELDDLKIENRKKYTSRENNGSKLIHFNNVEDFFLDVKKYPELKNMSFNTLKLNNWEPTRLSYIFYDWLVYVEINEYRRYFILKEDAILKKDRKEFFKSIVDNMELVMDEIWTKKITQADKEELLMLLWMVENEIDFDVVISEYK